MKTPRMTTRRWLTAVLLVALGIRAGAWCRLQIRYEKARRDEATYRKYYEEGRVTALRSLEKSQALMETRIALSLTSRGRADAVNAHLNRATQLLKEERHYCIENLTCRGSVADLAELEEYLDNFRARMKNRIGTP